MARDYKVVPFRRWHAEWVGWDAYALDSETLLAVEKLPTNWTIVLDGDPIMCGGTLEQWPGRHIAWALFSKTAGRHMTYITRHTLDYLARAKGRIETVVRADYEKGHRWAALLGFERESYLVAYGPAGEDHVGYVKFNR